MTSKKNNEQTDNVNDELPEQETAVEETIEVQEEIESSETIEELEEPETLPDDEEDETITALIAELAEAKQTADEAQDQALRAQAELQNFRRRKERETTDRIEQANGRLILELLPVVDDFERAFANIPEDASEEDAAWVSGFELILRKLQTVLEREGVTPIDATGAFDPNIHEAISVEPSDDIESGDIIAEVQKGYMLRERVLRPSYVRVAQ